MCATEIRFLISARPHAGAIGPDFLRMDDNAQPHHCRVADDYLQQDTTVRMEMASQIKNIRNMMQIVHYFQLVSEL